VEKTFGDIVKMILTRASSHSWFWLESRGIHCDSSSSAATRGLWWATPRNNAPNLPKWKYETV